MEPQSESRRFGTFLIVGGLTALLNFGIFMLLWKWLRVHDNLAVSLAYVASLLFHFTMNRIWTFQSTQGARGPQVVRYAGMAAINYGVTLAVVNLVTRILGFTPPVGLCAAIGATAICGYGMSRHWVFRTP